MRILVYVEGPADRVGLSALLAPVLEVARANRIGVSFLPTEGKARLLRESGRKAATHLSDHPEDWIFVLPDLYPMQGYFGTADGHSSCAELMALLQRRFDDEAVRVGVPPGVHRHFRPHCLKHDLEALLLAHPATLRDRLRTNDRLAGAWRLPVEEQDDNNPPKRVVEALFARYRKKPGYVDTVDAPWILSRAPLAEIVAACQHNFAQFVTELGRIIETGYL